ncbi:hypothetical protein ABK040_001995 [Willaertia magna]
MYFPRYPDFSTHFQQKSNNNQQNQQKQLNQLNQQPYHPLLHQILLHLDIFTLLNTISFLSKDFYHFLSTNNFYLWKELIERELNIKLIEKQETSAENLQIIENLDWKRIYFLLTKTSVLRWRRGFESAVDVLQQQSSIVNTSMSSVNNNNNNNGNNNADNGNNTNINIPFNNPCYFSPLIHNYHLKSMIIGDKKVGKSSLLFKLLCKTIPKKENLKKIISTDKMSSFSTLIQNTHQLKSSINLQIYDSNIVDIATYVKTCRMYGTFIHSVLILFNVRNKRSFFNAINKWLPMIRKRNPNLIVYLIGTKCDHVIKGSENKQSSQSQQQLKNNNEGNNNNKNENKEVKEIGVKREISREEVEKIAKEKNLIYKECSALTGEGIDELLLEMVNTVYCKNIQKMSKEMIDETNYLLKHVLLELFNLQIKQKVLKIEKFEPYSFHDLKYFEVFTESEKTDDNNAEESDNEEEEEIDEERLQEENELEEESGVALGDITKLTETSEEKELKGNVTVLQKYKEKKRTDSNSSSPIIINNENSKKNNNAIFNTNQWNYFGKDDDEDDEYGGYNEEDDDNSSVSESEEEQDEKMKQYVDKSFAEAELDQAYVKIDVNSLINPEDKRNTKYYANTKALIEGLNESDINQIKQAMEITENKNGEEGKEGDDKQLDEDGKKKKDCFIQ